MSLAGILAAGAAQGYGTAKNQEVDLHNQNAIENKRELLRQQFENQRFERGLKAGMQQAEMKAKHEANMYQRKREDKLLDTESERKFQDNQLDKRLSNQKSIAGMREAGRNKRSLLRRDSPSNGDFSSKELIKQIESNNKRIFDLKKELNSNPFAANDPQKGQLYQSEINRLEADNSNKQRMLGIEPEPQQQQASFDFVFNPQTGKLEPSR